MVVVVKATRKTYLDTCSNDGGHEALPCWRTLVDAVRQRVDLREGGSLSVLFQLVVDEGMMDVGCPYYELCR